MIERLDETHDRVLAIVVPRTFWKTGDDVTELRENLDEALVGLGIVTFLFDALNEDGRHIGLKGQIAKGRIAALAIVNASELTASPVDVDVTVENAAEKIAKAKLPIFTMVELEPADLKIPSSYELTAFGNDRGEYDPGIVVRKLALAENSIVNTGVLA